MGNLHSSRGIAVTQAVVPVRFAQSQVAASQTSVDLYVTSVADVAASAVDSNSVVGITVPFPAAVVGVSVDLSAAASAGTLSVVPTVGGTAKTAPAVSVTTETSKTSRATRWADTLISTDGTLGVQVTTDGDWDATTADLVVTVWLIVDMADYGEAQGG